MPTRTIWLRVVLLTVLAVGIDFWLERHTGHGLENPIGLLGLSGGIAAASGVLDWLLTEREKKLLKETTRAKFEMVRGWVYRILSPPVLVIFCLLAGVIAATYSSVTVMAPRGANAKFTLTPIDDAGAIKSGEALAGGDPERLLLATNPLGREFKLVVDGYIPKRVTLYPLTGLSIDADGDLEPLPTLLFRPPVDAIASLNSGGKLVVFKVNADRCETIGESSASESKARAFVLGSRRQIPASYNVLWNLELTGFGYGQVTTANTLRAWTNPELVSTRVLVEPGDQIYAEILSSQNIPKADATFAVGRDPFQDIAMAMLADATAARCTP